MTLQATKAAEKAHRKKAKAGKIPAPAEEWTPEDADALRRHLEAELAKTSDPKTRVKLRNLSLQMHGNPAAFRAKKPVFPTAPTPEMIARSGGRLVAEQVVPGAGPVPALNRHRSRSVLEVYGKHFTAEDLDVFRRIYEDAEAATTYKLTMNYEGASGGGRPWEKLGGLGHVSEAHRARYVRFNWVLSRLPAKIYHEALRWLVLELRSEGMDTLPSIVDAGRKWVPTLNHEPTARGVSIGVLKCLAAMLQYLYQLDAGMGRTSDSANAGSDSKRVRRA